MKYLLDLDGTLIDSNRRHYELMEELLKEYRMNVHFDALAFMQYKADGNSGKKYLTEILGMEQKEAERVMGLWLEQIETLKWIETDTLYPDTIAFLKAIEGNEIIYLSARQNRDNLVAELERLGIGRYATALYVVPPTEAQKQKLEIARQIQKDSSQMVVVGDTENEYSIALELNLPVYILNRGARSKTYWDTRGVKSIDNLMSICMK